MCRRGAPGEAEYSSTWIVPWMPVMVGSLKIVGKVSALPKVFPS